MRMHIKTRKIVMALLAFCQFALITPSIANDSIPEIPVALYYMGELDDQPVLQLKLTGQPGMDTYVIIVKDESGFPLYREKINQEHFTKHFLLKDDLGSQVLQLEIRNPLSKSSVVYDITLESRKVESLIISKR